MKNDSLLSETRGLLRRLNLKARKRLGQHFLIDEKVLDVITAAAELKADDVVIEVGPGLGVLTAELAGRAGKVLAVELDDNLAESLTQRLASRPNVTIINRDILDVDIPALLLEHGISSNHYKVVANLPYYITAPVLRHFLEAAVKPELMVVMVQKEVARTIAAEPGQRSILSIAVQFYGKPEIVGHVPSTSFYPAPAVDSSILRIEVFPRPQAAVTDEAGFFEIVRAGFAAPRKQIANSLAHGLGVPKSDVMALLDKAGIDPLRRAETLDVKEWACLWRVWRDAKC